MLPVLVRRAKGDKGVVLDISFVLFVSSISFVLYSIENQDDSSQASDNVENGHGW